MNLKHLLLATCSLACISLFSCSKNKDDNPQPEEPVYSTKLLKVYEIDTTKIAPADTISRHFFTYDNANRLISDSFSTVIIGNGSLIGRLITIKYKDNDTLAFMSIRKRWNADELASIDTTYYTFQNGNYISDTSVYDYGAALPRGTSKTEFIYQPGVIIRTFKNSVPAIPYSSVEQDTIHLTVVNDNINQQSGRNWTFANGLQQGSDVFETTASYLSNPNPFFKLFSATGKNYFAGDGIGIGNLYNNLYAPKHLISHQTSTNRVSSNYVSYDYSFRKDGYPLSATMTLEQYGVKSITKLIFVYAQ